MYFRNMIEVLKRHFKFNCSVQKKIQKKGSLTQSPEVVQSRSGTLYKEPIRVSYHGLNGLW